MARVVGRAVTDFIPFARPDIGEAEIAEVVDSLRGGWLSTGPKVARFEGAFESFLHGSSPPGTTQGAPVFAIAVSSGTAALHLALLAVGVGPGDEVITSAYTFTGCAEAIALCGATPVFVDVDESTLNLRADAIEDAISGRTRAIMPVHFAGCACDMAEIGSLARSHGLRIVDDAAHALPSTTQGKIVGAHGSDATAFSFYATKPLATGEGGMITCSNEEWRDACRVRRFHGITRDVADRYRSERPSCHYLVEQLGFKYNMTDIQAALGLHQLARAHPLRQRREAMAGRYREAFADLPLQLPAMPPEGELHAWHLFVIRLAEGTRMSRDEFIDRMAALGVGCSVHFMPLTLQPHWARVSGQSAEDSPVAVQAWQTAVSIPLYTAMTSAQEERVVEAVRRVLR